ncbi:MAG: ABC transporter substrate-binding protein [Pseudomonadota bacterium]
MSMGLGGIAARIDALAVLSINSDVVGVSAALARRMRNACVPNDFAAAAAIGPALISMLEQPLRLGMPFPFSMHAELVYNWLDALGLASPGELSVRTVPPPMMAESMAAREIDAFCVGEPQGSIAVERGLAELILPGCAIWRFAPEKVLATRRGWAEEEPDTTAGLMRACWRSARWLADPDRAESVAGLLSEARFIEVSAEAVLLADRVVMITNGPMARIGKIMEVDLPQPRSREALLEHPDDYLYREQLLSLREEHEHDAHGKTPVPAAPAAAATGIAEEEAA